MNFVLGEHVTPDNLNGAKAMYAYLSSHPEALKGMPEFAIQRYLTTLQAEIKALETGDYASLQGAYAQTGTSFSPDMEKYVDNMISQQRTEEARDYETQMRDTSLLSSGEQLKELGLSGSGVLQVGGMSSNGVSTADNVKTNLGQQRQIERYQQNMSIARSMISLAGSLASSGIYGASLGAARHAASAVAETTAHSALGAIDFGKKKEITGNYIQAIMPTNKRSHTVNNAKGYLY